MAANPTPIKANKITNHSYIRQDRESKKDAQEISLKKNNDGNIIVNNQNIFKIVDEPQRYAFVSEQVREVIEKTICRLLIDQNKSGGWPYNLTRKMMGEDCKGTSVIAYNMMEWYSETKNPKILDSHLCRCGDILSMEDDLNL